MKKTTKITLASLSVTLTLLSALLVARLVFAAGTATLSLTPSSGIFSVGDNFDVNVYEDSGSDMVNAVQANLTYGACLTFSGITSSPAFNVDAQSAGGSGTVTLARGATVAVSGSQLVATVHFTQRACGPATVGFAAGSAVVRSTDNQAESLATSGATFGFIDPSTMSISPGSKTFNKGDAITAQIFENSGTTPVNAVQADLNYPASLLTFVSIDPASTSAFPVDAQATGGGGSIKIGRGTTTPVTGNQQVGTVHFTAAAAGVATISFANSSAVIRSSDNGAQALTATGVQYTIAAPSSSGSGSSGSKSSSSPSKTTTGSSKSSSSGSTSTSTSTPTSTPTEPPVTTNVDNSAPTISDIIVTNLSLNTATVTWKTSEPATSEVDYGLSTNYILNVTDPALTKDHSVVIRSKDLVPHTAYHYIIKSVDAKGNLAISQDLTFKTEPASSKSSAGGFWAVFAAVLVLGAAGYVGYSYYRRMNQPGPPGPGPAAGGTSGPGGGAVIKPNGSSKSSAAAALAGVPQNAIILNAKPQAISPAPPSVIKPTPVK